MDIEHIKKSIRNIPDFPKPGIQEESTFLGVPCLTVRDNTERPITIEQGTNRLVGTEYSNIPEIVRETIVEKSVPRVPELWDGKSSERIARVLLNHSKF